MISNIIYSLKFIQYKLFAKHKKGHAIHSPFMFNLICLVFRNKNVSTELKDVFNLHNKYRQSKQKLKFNEIGAGSNFRKKTDLTIGQIIRKSSISKKYGKLIYDLIKYFNPKNILELGSSVGISSTYISQANPKSNFISIEGVQEKINVAETISKEINQTTKFICANFDNSVVNILNDFDKLDFVFFDGNHKKESTINYFQLCLNKTHNNTVFIFDDIHWSNEMEEAWDYIKKHEKVRVSVDLFRMGLVFFKQELSCEHYVIKF